MRGVGGASVGHRGFVDALVVAAGLLGGAAEQTGRSMADDGGLVAEGVVDADAVGALFGAGAAVGSVDVVAQRGAGVTGLGVGRVALVVSACLAGGAAEESTGGVADDRGRGEAWVFGGRLFGEAFADDTSFVFGAAGAAVMLAFAEGLMVVTG